jgi:hypothetical protein
LNQQVSSENILGGYGQFESFGINRFQFIENNPLLFPLRFYRAVVLP